MSHPVIETHLQWDESNPDWWQAQCESRGEMVWQWLVNEWSPMRDALKDIYFTAGSRGETRIAMLQRRLDEVEEMARDALGLSA